MPVLIERRRRPRKLGVDYGLNRIDIGLVNNMPDTALEATERQYAALLSEAAGDDVLVHLHLYSLPEIRRTDRAAEHTKKLYRSLDVLTRTPLDALIVTGAEPQTHDLREEIYWPSLTKLIDWAQANTISTIFSCLAAHAAVLHLDGIARRPLAKKLFGVFDETIAEPHPLTKGLAGLPAPHSRWNELREPDLRAKNYSILTHSDEAGVGMFAKKDENLLIFLQGHPEYEAETLLREYRRDIGRYLRAERSTYPGRPRHYFDARASDRVIQYRKRATIRRERDLLQEFPIFELRRSVRHSWRPGAVAFYRNWLNILDKGKPVRIATRILKQAGVATR
ncbi:MAG TPA: homoserine O-succinyltransferase [Stellaceae bacterium]|jgi:homoserine O-succinyltransferase